MEPKPRPWIGAGSERENSSLSDLIPASSVTTIDFNRPLTGAVTSMSFALILYLNLIGKSHDRFGIRWAFDHRKLDFRSRG